uniref:F-box domain-containing protein n=1 Tax=Spongospora subterranea TaxID=70186 RepID=A0A0H5QHH6_9EUKA|eukprot:CRZ01428.1 hypothetical protein [Spongospora subterranea]
MNLANLLSALYHLPILSYLEPLDAFSLTRTSRQIAYDLKEITCPVWKYFYDYYRPESNSYIQETISYEFFSSMMPSFIIRFSSGRHGDVYRLPLSSEFVIHPQTEVCDLAIFLVKIVSEGELSPLDMESLNIRKLNGEHLVLGVKCREKAGDVLQQGDRMQIGISDFYEVVDVTWIRWCRDCYRIGRLWPYRTLFRRSPCHRIRPISDPSDPTIVDNLFPNLVSCLQQGMTMVIHPRLVKLVWFNANPSLDLVNSGDAGDVGRMLDLLESLLVNYGNVPQRNRTNMEPLFRHLWSYLNRDYRGDNMTSVVNCQNEAFCFATYSGHLLRSDHIVTRDQSDPDICPKVPLFPSGVNGSGSPPCGYLTLHDMLLDLDEYFSPDRIPMRYRFGRECRLVCAERTVQGGGGTQCSII